MIVEHLGKYRASDGKIYLIGDVDINGKTYIYGKEDGKDDYGETTYGYYFGEIIALDYFQAKSQFLQKKLLMEKKLKSTSQRHVNIPAKNINPPNNNFSNQVKNNPKGIVPR